MKKELLNIGFIGNFGDEHTIGGQITKTREVLAGILERKGINNDIIETVQKKGLQNNDFSNELYIVDTKGKNLISFFLKTIKAFRNTKNIIIMMYTKSYFKVLPFYIFLNSIYKRNIYEVVTGGTRHEYIKTKELKYEKQIKKIFVESSYMKKCYNNLGLENVVYLPNFKKIKPVSETEIYKRDDNILRCCTYSRIDSQKGIDIAIDVMQKFKKEAGRITLDIIGPVDKEFEKEFNELFQKAPDTVRYIGSIDGNNSSEILKKYDILLFPTKWKTEGFPGSFIDAMQAGLVILSTERQNFKDIIINGVNGWLLPDEYVQGYVDKLQELESNVQLLREMQKRSLLESMKYDRDIVLKDFLDEIMC